jgi:uncharacterized protein YbbC (DUF1343 family)
MLKYFLKNTVLFPIIIGIVFLLISCGTNSKQDQIKSNEILKKVQDDKNVIVGANQTSTYLPLLNGKKVGIVANQTSVIFNSEGYTHIVDSLVSLQVNITQVFAPEHGFRGKADAGEKVVDGFDIKTGIPIISLYSANKKPKLEQISETKKYESDIEKGVYKLDIMVFDLQDVGTRFYTYISTLHYVMEACAEANIPLLILDRPNPNGHYIDGPVLEPEHKSFVGMHPVPVVYGMTIGEYAQMINGEKWLMNSVICDITVIPVKNYTHQTAYSLPIKPSPNLPNDVAINLYPSLCFFEGTNVSAGRGTDKQFQVFGSPYLNTDIFPYTYKFTPQPNEGAKYPKHQDKLCYGMDLSQTKRLNRLDLNYLIEAYQATENKDEFFNAFFTKLAGTTKLQEQIELRHTAYELKKNWVQDLQDYDEMRQQYLIYE